MLKYKQSTKHLSKNDIIQIGIQYISTHNKLPNIKLWTNATMGCSRDRVYEHWPNFKAYLEDLKKYINLPTPVKNKQFIPVKNKQSVPAKIDCVVSFSLEEAVLYVIKQNNISPPDNKTVDDLVMFFTKTDKETKINGWPYSLVKKYLSSLSWYTFSGPRYTSLLDLEDLKLCGSCQRVMYKDEFSINNSAKIGVQSKCKKCVSLYMKKYPLRSRRDLLKKCTPIWADINKIKEIYDRCPEGSHVDHIIPLQGKYVCGLHVENNLQYLTSSENISKHNYHESEEWWK